MERPTYTRRERQVLDLLYANGPSAVAQIEEGMEDPPSNSAVRALLRTMVERGYVRIERDGKRYVYHPVESREEARRGALSRVVEAFFDQSPLKAAMALVRMSDAPSDAEVAELEALIARAKAAQAESGP